MMSETHSKPSTDARRNGGGSRHSSESDNPPTTPSAARSKSDSGTPARPGSALNARQTSGTPRLRSRPAPIHSLSTPLGRSLSMRVSKKEKRWSMRLEDPKSSRTSTYQDDYQSPEALSLQSLNLETTTDQAAEFNPNAPTTYRESYRWQRRRMPNMPRSEDKGLARSTSDEKDTPNGGSHNSTLLTDGRPDTSTGSRVSSTASRNGQVRERHAHICHGDPPHSQAALQSPPSAHSSSFLKRNSSSGVISGQRLSSADRVPSASSTADRMPSASSTAHRMPAVPSRADRMSSASSRADRMSSASSRVDRMSSASSNEDDVSIKPAATQKGMSIPKPASGKTLTVNGEGVQSPATPQSSKPGLTNGDRGWSVPNSDERTPRRMRAYQLQSSTGGSPFVYGSDSGSWV